MSQPKKQVKIWIERISNNSTRNKSITLSNEQDSLIKRKELSKILQPFALKEEQLLSQIAHLQNKNNELNSLLITQKQEYQRSKHLLSIKEQVCIAQQKQIQQLKNHQKKYIQFKQKNKLEMHHSNINHDLNEISKIQNIDEYDSQEEKENRQFQTKRRICLKKSIRTKVSSNKMKVDSLQQTQNLQIARLKSQINRLEQFIVSLQVQIQLLQIENQFIGKDCEITNKRQRKLHECYTDLLKEQRRDKYEQQTNLNKKCLMLERYIDKLTQKINNENQKQDDCPILNHIPTRKTQEIHPPITPHFSSNAFVFPIANRKTPTKTDYIPKDEIFQTYSSFCEQDNE